MNTIMTFIASILALSAITFSAHAALSGFYDSAEQINTILASPEVADALRQFPIKSMERDDDRSDGTIKWEIEAGDCNLDVYLAPIKPTGVGKTTYKVEVGKACER